MPTKEDILHDITSHSTVDICNSVKNGVLSMDDLAHTVQSYSPFRRQQASKKLDEVRSLYPAIEQDTEEAYQNYLKDNNDGDTAVYVRTRISRIREASEIARKENLWNEVDKSDIAALRRFVSDNPDNSHCEEANRIINKLREEEYLGYDISSLRVRLNSVEDKKAEIEAWIKTKKITKKGLLNEIGNDRNFLPARVIIGLVKGGTLSWDDLSEVGIEKRLIKQMIDARPRQRFNIPQRLDQIKRVSTELYFWGFPSSGKTCAIGAILSVANNGKIAKSMDMDTNCQGYAYMTQLADLFSSDELGILPEGTPTDATYEMSFTLEDEKGKIHPITCIDLAGELVRSMYKTDANMDLDEGQQMSLDTLTRLLVDKRSENRKIHFFVLEYGGEERLYEGYNQAFYLNGALRYIKKQKIFEKETDAIYLILTKVDKTGLTGIDLQNKLTEYILSKYNSLFQGLESICRNYHINNGSVLCIPFTIGDVCFQDYCVFDSRAASNVVGELLSRTKGFSLNNMTKTLSV